MAPAANVFISHGGADFGIAHALSTAIEAIFDKRVSVSHSTKHTDGGIGAGEDWFRWIGKQVEDSKVSVVLLTHRYLESDWMLWETGAVYGAALSSGAGGVGPRLRPLSYAVDADDLPRPLRAANIQMAKGDSLPEMQQFFADLIDDLDVLGQGEAVEAGRRLDRTVKAYIREVKKSMIEANKPVPPGPPPDPETLTEVLELTITAIRAFSPSVEMNGRYFYAASKASRNVLARHNDIYVETLSMPEEYGLEYVDLERDADTIVICKSYLARKPMYEVLEKDLMKRYDPKIRSGIDPSQGWVLASPVLVQGADPLGVVCIYGQKPPVRDEEERRRLLTVATHVSDVYSRVIAQPTASGG